LRKKMNQRLLLAGIVPLFLFALVIPAFATSMSYTYTIADLGQGGWGGGPLYSNGMASGANGVSFMNGADLAVFKATTWTSGTSAITNGPGVDICGTLTVMKTDGLGLPSSLPAPGVYKGFCLSFVLGTDIPITGAPVNMFGTIVRVTPVK
jgi:hypothetical protein